jgi:hypothetical protein
MFAAIKNIISNNIINIPGWTTRRRIVVIESDDWGSVRMPSKQVYNSLLKQGVRVDKCHYCTYDSLENAEDLNALSELLNEIKDKNGNTAIITANTVVANPDFEKTQASNFQEYHYKLITDSYNDFEGCSNSFQTLKDLNTKSLFSIQSHGREHLNIIRWMHYLRNDFPETKLAFEHGVYGLSTTITSENRKSFLPAFDFETRDEELYAVKIAKDGMRIFKDLFGFESRSFIAPNYVWSKLLVEGLAYEGVRYIQGTHFHTYRVSEGDKSSRRLRYFGKKNDFGQIDLVRNAFFEPSENPGKDWVSSCLSEIQTAFFWNHPAVICSHRVNFMGGMSVKNREKNLLLLKKLLSEILVRWPDTEFMSSNQLGNLIMKEK